MKVKVNRVLSGGLYHINFVVGDFTPEEVAKMNSFGIPTIRMRRGVPGNRPIVVIPVTQINPQQFDAAFVAESEAKEYEQDVIDQLRAELKRLHGMEDKFTSSEEVPL